MEYLRQGYAIFRKYWTTISCRYIHRCGKQHGGKSIKKRERRREKTRKVENERENHTNTFVRLRCRALISRFHESLRVTGLMKRRKKGEEFDARITFKRYFIYTRYKCVYIYVKWKMIFDGFIFMNKI